MSPAIPPAFRPRHGFGRPAWAGNLAEDATRSPVRQSLCRYYPSRDDATRTREARRQTKALRQGR